MSTPSKAHYVIGIDLGTTNCTLAYALKESGTAQQKLTEITTFAIPQVSEPSTQTSHTSLPSFIYFPLKEELDKQISSLEWDDKRQHCVGLFAKKRGSELPAQMISSAKSWLCHPSIDRRAKILPQSEKQDSGKMSPLEACAQFLVHLREAWNHEMKKKAPFDKQTILITVPASFDPSARQLVEEAAKMAEYPEVLLLEEPQAAFYSWIHQHHETWRKELTIGDVVLVVDIGGGTTDFTLIKVASAEGDLSLERLAVGSHLLLGGDNIDLALAYYCKQKLEDQGHAIDDWQLQHLVHSCRSAKEKLFTDPPAPSADITIHGRGSRLIGGTLKTTLSKEEVHQLIIDGFFPVVAPTERSSLQRKSGLQEVGLPYAQDARVSCQLAKFLSMTGESDSDSMQQFVMPTAVLFNGGTMKAPALRERIIKLLNSWAQQLNKPAVKVLSDADYDFAVSRGAAYYGLARAGKGIRIKSGTSRSYFIGIESAAPAVPGIPTPLQAVCIVPFGMEEGTEQELPHQKFALVVGEPVSFRFFSRATAMLSNGEPPVMGTSVRQWKTELTELNCIETILEGDALAGKTIQVSLKSRVNELGVLELWCVSKDNKNWKLEFNTRTIELR